MHSPPTSSPRSAERRAEPGRGVPVAAPPVISSLFGKSWNLGRVVSAWAEHGAPLPVAVVVSIFDDVCEELETDPTPRPAAPHPLALEHVVIDDDGRARLMVLPDDAVTEISRLLYDTLSAGSGDIGVPAAVRPLIDQATSDDRWVRPPGPEPMRAWLRASLGPPAGRDEVLDCCGALVPIAEALASEGPTELAETQSALSLLEVPALASEGPSAPEIEIDLASLLPVKDPRPVFRHEVELRVPVSLPAAPVARVGSVAPDLTSDIILPDENRHRFWVMLFLAVCSCGLVGWLLGIFP